MSPFGEAVLEAAGASLVASEESDGVVGEHAVWAAAVGDDVDVGGESLDARGEVVDRDGDRASDVSGLVLGCGTDVDNDHLAVSEPFREFVPPDLVELCSVAEVGGREFVEVFVVGCGDVA